MSEAGGGTRYTALVLAASRQGSEDAVAQLQQKSHKCLVEVDGITMIERAVQVLLDSERCGRVLVSIESESILEQVPRCQQWLRDGSIEVTPSAANMADSILKLAEDDSLQLPLLISTADSVLHTPELIAEFADASSASAADVTVAVTPEAVVRSGYPDADLGFFQFKDGGYSFSNLYAMRTAKALEAANIFRSGGQFRKRPQRILQTFGVWNLLAYKFRLRSIEDTFRKLSRKLGLSLEVVELAYPFGSLDVDNPKTFALAEATLRERR